MRTGFDFVENVPRFAELDDDVAGIMRLFVEDAIRTACKYSEAKGIESIGEEVMRRALKYEAMHFFEREGLEERYVNLMNDETETSSDDEEEEEDDLTASDDEAVNVADLSPIKDADFCAAVDTATDRWDAWDPQDPIQALIKRSVV